MRVGTGTVIALVIATGIFLSGCGSDSSVNTSDDHPPVVGTAWLMQSFEVSGKTTEMHEGVRLPSLEFKPNDTVALFDGCNSGGGEATVGDEKTIEFGPLRTTLMACPGETGEVSNAIMKVLQGETDYSFDGGYLVISRGDDSLTYSDGNS